MELIAELYLNTTSDINTAFEDFLEMYNQIKLEESLLYEKLEINISFDNSAIDELIKLSIEKGGEVGSMTFQLAKKLEYGLKLVRDRSGGESFVINGRALTDMERFINELIKRSYRQGEEPGYSEDLENEQDLIE